MTPHTNERIVRAGHRQIATESGKPLFEVFSGAVGPAEADANEVRLVSAWNAHDWLITAAKAGVEYDKAILSCANDPELMASFCTAEGGTLDTLYAAWISATFKALAAAGVPA